MTRLPPKQDRFIAAYLQTGNAAESYRAAGYSTKGAEANAIHMLARPAIRAEVERRQGELRKNSEMDLKEATGIVTGLARDAGLSPRDRLAAVQVWARLTGNDSQTLKHKTDGDKGGLAELIFKLASLQISAGAQTARVPAIIDIHQLDD